MSGVWRGVRYREDVGWEMRCDSCAADKGASYWPLDFEFWNLEKGLSRCRGCWNAYQRRNEKRRRIHRRSNNLRKYQREWAARKRQQQREDEGRQRYERRKAA